MARRLRPALLLSTCLLAATAPTHADTVQVLTTGAYKQVVLAMVPGFEARTGNTVVVSNDTAGALLKRVEGGEPFDVLVLTPTGLQALAASGRIVAGSVRPLAKGAIGVAVKTGAPRPDVGTIEQFKQALSAARHVAYIDPSAGGSSGVYLEGLFQRLGIAEQIHAKAVLVRGGLVAEKLVTGEADLVVHQISEILPVTGADFVGPIPEAVQNYTNYSGALGGHALHPAAGQAFLDALSGTDALAVLQAKGLYPPN